MDCKKLSPAGLTAPSPFFYFNNLKNDLPLRLFAALALLATLGLNLVVPFEASAASTYRPLDGSEIEPGSFQPGLITVKFKPNSLFQNKPSFDFNQLRPDRYISSPQFREFGFSGFQMDRVLPGIFYYQVSNQANLKSLLNLVRSDPAVEYAEPNYKMQLQKTPNDPFFNDSTLKRQYYLSKINAEGAWDVTTGSTNVVVAIVDTGIRINHYDMLGKVITDRARTFLKDPVNGELIQTVANKLLPASGGAGYVNLPPLSPPAANSSNPLPDNAVNDGTYTTVKPYTPGGLAPDPETLQPYFSAWDPDGHGTAVAGLIAANSDNGRGMAGLNWNVRLLPVQVCKSDSCDEIAVASGITYAADNKARIINLSLGGNRRSEVIEGAIRYAQSKGVIIVAAAGNNVTGSPSYPAAYAGVIGVGATDSNDKVTSFSNFGADVSVVAPGSKIWTTYCNFLDPFEIKNVPPNGKDPGSCAAPNSTPQDTLYCRTANVNAGDPDACRAATLVEYYQYHVDPASSSGSTTYYYYLRNVYNDSYAFLSGTSFSAPIVTGIVALMVAVQPTLTNDQAQNILQQTADRVPGMTPSGRDPYYGFGRVNAAKAVAAAQNDIYTNSKTSLQGTVQGAVLSDVIVSLDLMDRNTSLTTGVDLNSGSFRFDNLGSGSYTLRALVPKATRMLGPVTINATGAAGEVIKVNFDFTGSKITTGPGAVAPDQGAVKQPTPAVPGVPGVPVPLLAENSTYFMRINPQVSTSDRYYFPEVGHTLSGNFKQFWDVNGGLSIFGFPISEPFQEVSATDGKVYTVQYFERNRFEYHAEYAGTKSEVLLGLLGSEESKGNNFDQGKPLAAGAEGRFFQETHHTLTGNFYNYWQSNGGLSIFGFPISEPFQEVSTTDGKVYTVQYFERNRFEFHPENSGSRYAVLLGLLGVDLARSRNYIAPLPRPSILNARN